MRELIARGPRRARRPTAVKQYVIAWSTPPGSPELRLGASPRATLQLLRASRACAALEGRDYVIPDDVQALAVPVLAHRLLPTAEAHHRAQLPSGGGQVVAAAAAAQKRLSAEVASPDKRASSRWDSCDGREVSMRSWLPGSPPGGTRFWRPGPAAALVGLVLGERDLVQGRACSWRCRCWPRWPRAGPVPARLPRWTGPPRVLRARPRR